MIWGEKKGEGEEEEGRGTGPGFQRQLVSANRSVRLRGEKNSAGSYKRKHPPPLFPGRKWMSEPLHGRTDTKQRVYSRAGGGERNNIPS